MENTNYENNVIHEDVIRRVQEQMPQEEPIYEVSELFRVFGDSSRSRIICALHIEEMCVNDLAVLLTMTQSAVSHQLRILRDARLVKSRKQGRVVYYSLDDDHIDHIFEWRSSILWKEWRGNNVLQSRARARILL